MNIYHMTRCIEREVTSVMTRLANFPPSKVILVCAHDATSCSFLNHVTSGVGSPHTVQVRLRDWRGVRGQGGGSTLGHVTCSFVRIMSFGSR